MLLYHSHHFIFLDAVSIGKDTGLIISPLESFRVFNHSAQAQGT